MRKPPRYMRESIAVFFAQLFDPASVGPVFFDEVPGEMACNLLYLSAGNGRL